VLGFQLRGTVHFTREEDFADSKLRERAEDGFIFSARRVRNRLLGE
jgi:hypothetical protein